MLADPDPPIQQLGGVFMTRLAIWRNDLPRMQRGLDVLKTRATPDGGHMLRSFYNWQEGKPFDRASWDRVVAAQLTPQSPHRFQVVSLQRMAELAVIINERATAIDTIRTASTFGLIDIVWLDHCPLFRDMQTDPTFRPIRAEVAARASRVLAAFRAAGG